MAIKKTNRGFALKRRIIAARLERAYGDGECGCGCGSALAVDERIAWDAQKRVGFKLEHWLKLEGLS